MILLEILAVLFEGLVELSGDLVFELVLRCFGHSISPRKERNPIMAAIGYALFGLIAGGLSLLIFPQSFARSEHFHGISLVAAPVLAGLAMAGLGWWLERHGKRRLRLDSFIYGFIFAMPMAIVRFLYTS